MHCTGFLPIKQDLFSLFQDFGIVIATGVSEESDYVKKSFRDSVSQTFIPLSMETEFPEIKFNNLKSEWLEDTAFLSSIFEISMHPAYQQIIGMGKTALPLILNELINKTGHWFWALKSITGEDPITLNQRGNINKMTNAWIQWGIENNYI
jgi:hypothetical protein